MPPNNQLGAWIALGIAYHALYPFCTTHWHLPYLMRFIHNAQSALPLKEALARAPHLDVFLEPFIPLTHDGLLVHTQKSWRLTVGTPTYFAPLISKESVSWLETLLRRQFEHDLPHAVPRGKHPSLLPDLIRVGYEWAQLGWHEFAHVCYWAGRKQHRYDATHETIRFTEGLALLNHWQISTRSIVHQYTQWRRLPSNAFATTKVLRSVIEKGHQRLPVFVDTLREYPRLWQWMALTNLALFQPETATEAWKHLLPDQPLPANNTRQHVLSLMFRSIIAHGHAHFANLWLAAATAKFSPELLDLLAQECHLPFSVKHFSHWPTWVTLPEDGLTPGFGKLIDWIDQDTRSSLPITTQIHAELRDVREQQTRFKALFEQVLRKAALPLASQIIQSGQWNHVHINRLLAQATLDLRNQLRMHNIQPSPSIIALMPPNPGETNAATADHAQQSSAQPPNQPPQKTPTAISRSQTIM